MTPLSNPSEAIQKAHMLAQTGDLAGAAALCRAILKQAPGHFYALFMLGNIEAGAGRVTEAEKLLANAVKAEPRSGDALASYGNVLLELKRHEEAVGYLDNAIALQPQNLNALIYRGLGYVELGRSEDALKDFDRALALSPASLFALQNRATVLIRMNRHKEAWPSIETLLKLAPGHVPAVVNFALLLMNDRRHQEALAVLSRALAAEPANPDLLQSRGDALLHLKRHGEAVSEYDKAIALKPGSPALHVARGNALLEMQCFREAMSAYDRAITLDPACAEAHLNRGNVLMEQNRLEEALGCCEQAIAAKPGYAIAFLLRANILMHLRRAECFASYNRAIALNPDYPEGHYHRASALLLHGRFKEGWQDAEYRWKVADRGFERPALSAPEWQGEPLEGRSIVVFSEQGLGDTIQFVRLLPRLVRLGARVTFLCHTGLIRLFHPFAAEMELTDFCASERRFDFQCALMSLAHRLGIEPGTISGGVPYLFPEDALAAQWRERIGGSGFKVGIGWQGNPSGKIDQGRSIPLDQFEPLSRIQGVRLIALQRHHGLEQLAHLPPTMHVETLGEFDAGKDGFIDTAAIMANFDLVITSDTAAAHLAGALGRPVWVGLKHIPDWRWMLDRGDSPWYPSMRLFRQPARDDWNSVFHAMAEELRPMVQSSEKRMTPLVPTSWGELLDKITILEIKSERLTAETALKNVRHELARLTAIVPPPEKLDPKIATLKAALKRVNETLWQIEDDIREKEAKKTFDEKFISLARAVYHTNDERGRIKRDINTLMNSELFEEKQYAAY